MQFATQYAAHSGPDYHNFYLPDSSLGFDAVIPVSSPPSLDGLYTSTSNHVWDDGRLKSDPEYAAPEAKMVLPNHGPAITAHAQVNYDIGNCPPDSHASGNGQGIPMAQLPGALCASLLGGGPLWNACPSSLYPEAGASINTYGWSDLAGIPPSLTVTAGPVFDPAIDSPDQWSGSSNLMQALSFCEAQCGTYSACSSPDSPSSSAACPPSISDWSTIFSPGTSLSQSDTAPTRSSSDFPSPQFITVTLSAQGSKRQRGGKTAPRVGRVRSSAYKSVKPVPSSSITFPSGRVHPTAPRNKQIAADEIKDPVRRGDTWFCSNCSYQTRRKGDMQRHVKTHSGNTETVCCAVPVEEVPEYAGAVHLREGRAMAGGCMKSFKRKDSFLRHLKAPEGACIGPTSS